jgi:hypothetical protein
LLGEMPRVDAPMVRITVRGGDGRTLVDSVEPLSPYVVETIVDHARGAAARAEVTLPSTTPHAVLAAIEAALARRLGAAGVRVVYAGAGVEYAAPTGAVAARPEPPVSVPEPAPASAGVPLTLIMCVGRLLHDLERERGYAAVYSASAYRLFVVERSTQERATDAAVTALRAFMAARRDELPPPLEASTAPALEALAALPSVRVRVTVGGLASAAVIDAYRPSVSSLLAVVHMAAAIERDADLARMALAYAAFLNAKEQAGRERAEVASAWAVDGLRPDPLAVESAIAAQNAFLRVFEMTASPTVVDAFHLRATDPVWAAVAEMERLARGGVGAADGYRPDAAGWFECMTAKLDGLRQVEDLQFEAMLRHATLSRRH